MASSNYPAGSRALILTLCALATPHLSAGEPETWTQPISKYPLPIVVTLQVAGTEARAVLDTGSTHSLFSPKLQPLLGKHLKTEKFDAAGGTGTLETFEGAPLRLGPFDLGRNECGVTDLSFMGGPLGVPVDAVLGVDAFNNLVIDVQRDQRTIRFSREIKVPPGRSSVTLGLGSGFTVARFKLGDRTWPFVLDMGLCGSVNLTEEAFTALSAQGLIDGTSQGSTLDATGLASTQYGHFRKCQLLGLDLDGEVAHCQGPNNLIGLGLLSRLHLIFDLPDEKLYYERLSTKTFTDPTDLLGVFFVYQEGAAVILNIMPQGPAHQAGLRKGDRVSKLGPLEKDHLNLEALYELCNRDDTASLPFIAHREGQKEPITGKIKIKPETPSPPEK